MRFSGRGYPADLQKIEYIGEEFKKELVDLGDVCLAGSWTASIWGTR